MACADFTKTPVFFLKPNDDRRFKQEGRVRLASLKLTNSQVIGYPIHLGSHKMEQGKRSI